MDAPAARDADPDARLADTSATLERMRQREELLAHGISHDLRAPLRAINGYVQVLASQYGDALGGQGRGYVDRIRDAAGRMDRLIGNLLQLSHVARAPLRPEEVDLGLLAEWCLAELQDLEPDVEARLDVQADLRARGDERLLKQLMEHLLRNAWTFSRGGTVRIDVRGETAGDRLRLTVADGGRGFDMRYAQRMFEPFQRLHGPDQGGGDGLGLAIASTIVERHGGRLWAESVPDEGARFHFDLPRTAIEDEGGEGSVRE